MNILNTTSNNGISGSFGKMAGGQNPNMTLLTAGQSSSGVIGGGQYSNDHSNMMVTAYNNMHHQGNSSRVMTSENNPANNSADYGGGMMMTGGIRMTANQHNTATSGDHVKSNAGSNQLGQSYL